MLTQILFIQVRYLFEVTSLARVDRLVHIAIFISARFDVLCNSKLKKTKKLTVLEQLLLHPLFLLNDVAVFVDSDSSRLADFGITLIVFFFRVSAGIFSGVLF